MSGGAGCAASTRSRRRPTTCRGCVALARRAIDGGARLVQYRSKRLPASERLRQARRAPRRCAAAAACRSIVNDDLELAIALGADGVHLGRDDGDPREAREAPARGDPRRLLLRRSRPGRRRGGRSRCRLRRASAACSPRRPSRRPCARASPRSREAQRRVARPGRRDRRHHAANAARGGRRRRRHARGHLRPLRRAGRDRRRARPLTTLRHGIPTPMYERSQQLFEASQRVIPGGVNSPVRAFRAVGGTPVFFREGKGAWLVDVDGNRYVDYVGLVGPDDPRPRAPGSPRGRVRRGRRAGLSFGAPTELELEMAELLTRSLPSIEQVRLVSSGTEAVMSALRLARGFTGRSLIVKFEGCYHGHSDFLLVKAGSGALTFGNPTSAGVPAELTSKTLVLDYNDPQQVEDAFARFGPEIAAVVLEPVAGNMNFVRPSQAFLDTLRRAVHAARRGAHLRRGDDRLSRRPAGRAGRVRDPARPHDARQGDRRRHARRRLRRPPRHHGEARAARPGLPGRHAVGKPGRGDARDWRPSSGCWRPDSSRRCRRRRSALTEGLVREAREAGVAFSAASLGGMFGLFFRPRRRRRSPR